MLILGFILTQAVYSNISNDDTIHIYCLKDINSPSCNNYQDGSFNEKYIATRLDYFLNNYFTQMYDIPLSVLHNIFFHPQRELNDMQRAYNFITHSTKELYPLLKSIDGDKLNEETQEYIFENNEFLGYLPKFSSIIIDSIRERIERKKQLYKNLVYDVTNDLYHAFIYDISGENIDYNRYVDIFNNTLLTKAIMSSSRICKFLLRQPTIDVNLPCNFNNAKLAPLHVALFLNKFDIFKELLSHQKIDVNIKFDNIGPIQGEITLLYWATLTNKFNISYFEALLQHPKIDVNQESNIKNLNHYKYKETPLIASITEKAHNYENAKQLLRHPKIDVNKVAIYNGIEMTALLAAITRNSPEIVKLILENPDVDVNTKTLSHSNGEKGIATPLILALTAKRKEIVKLLLKHPKIDVNLKINKNGTKDGLFFEEEEIPLLSAIRVNDKELLDALLQRPDIDVNIYNKVVFKNESGLVWESKISSLGFAFTIANFFAFESLLKHPNISASSFYSNNMSLLYLCLFFNLTDFAKSILKHPSVDVNAISTPQDNKFEAPLHVAVRNELLDCIELLLDNDKIDINVKDYQGKTPIELTDNETIKELFRKHNKQSK